jgi:membrane protease YdiL (CAAX protease family)
MQGFVRRHPFAVYYATAVLVVSAVVMFRYAHAQAMGAAYDYNKSLIDGIRAFGDGRVYANVISIGWVAIFRDPIYFGVFVFAGAPTIAAIATSWVGWRGDGLRRLFSRLRPWSSRAYRRGALGGYAVIAAIALGVSLLHLKLIGQFQGQAEVVKAMTPFGLPAGAFLIAFLLGGFIDEGATCEELGWRGFGLPTLLRRMSPLAAALTLGALWWAWHFPREIPALVQHGIPPGFFLDQAEFLLLVVSMTVVMTFFFHLTGGSLIPAVLLHGWGNFLTKCVSLGAHDLDDRNGLFILAALVVLVFAGPDLGRRRCLALSEGGEDQIYGPVANGQSKKT